MTTQTLNLQNPLRKEQSSETTNETVRDRMYTYMKARNIKIADMCKLMGKSPAWFSTMRVGTKLENIRAFCDIYPDVNFDWLAYGEGEMLNEVIATPFAITGQVAATNNQQDAQSLLTHQNLTLQKMLETANAHIKQLTDDVARLTDVNAAQNERFMSVLEKLLVK